MTTAHRVWIPCTVADGMFSTEVAAEVTLGKTPVSFFADRSLIKETDGQTYILVTLVGDNGLPNHKTILLPSESLESGSRWLSIPEESLLAVA